MTEREPDSMADIIVSMSSVFAGIHLTDISAPRCFELAARLRERLDIPVLHDDQEGTAAALLAALTNGLRMSGKTLEGSTVVVAGLGPGGMSIVRILIAAGVGKNLIACDGRGAVTSERGDLTDELAWVAANTNHEGRAGTAAELIEGADAFIGLSSPGILSAADVKKMARIRSCWPLPCPNRSCHQLTLPRSPRSTAPDGRTCRTRSTPLWPSRASGAARSTAVRATSIRQ